MHPRLVSIARSGRHVVLRTADGLELVDALGTTRVAFRGRPVDFACVNTMLWVIPQGGRQIDRFALATGRALPAIALSRPAAALVAERGDQIDSAIAVGEPSALVLGDAVLEIDHVAPRVFPLGGRRVAVVDGDTMHLLELGRPAPLASVRVGGAVDTVESIYGGRLLAVKSDDGAWTVLRADGTRVHRVAVGCAGRWAVASGAGIVITVDAESWKWIDLRCGVVRAEGTASAVFDDVDVSSDGRYLALACRDGAGSQVLHLASAELLASACARGSSPVIATAAAGLPPAAVSCERTQFAEGRHVELDEDAVDAGAAATSAVLAALVPRGLGEPLRALPGGAASHWPPYASAREHLDDILEQAAARVGHAIAEGAACGKLALAPDALRALGIAADARGRLAEVMARTAGRTRATIAVGRSLPLVELMRELDLSPTAGHVVALVLAASQRGEVAKLFQILADDPRRPGIDRCAIETILAGSNPSGRAAIAAELAASAPLRRYGVVAVTGESALDTISLAPIVIARLREHIPRPSAIRPLFELWLAPKAARDLAEAVTRPRPAHAPLRLVLRGRRGAGRRSLAAALAASLGRATAEIDCAHLPRAGVTMAGELQQELRRAVLRGCIPVVAGLELADAGDAEGQDRIRQVVRTHPGPIVVRAAPDSSLPIDPGFSCVVLPALSECERAAYWRRALARAGLPATEANALAARWRLGPGQIEEVISKAGNGATLDDLARQHVATRLGHLATRVERLSRWENVALPDDVSDSVRELIARVAHRKTVFDDWGFDAKLTTARGITALFYGPPGTGKSMVASLVARELGLELYRIDLSRIMSKWIGETEKNLAEVFDAAEEGQVAILFDEADALFAKRTEVKSSVDRYANAEVNYLLQRLDTFEGVAILTTNLDGSIDPAFKRRMSLRLQFPFPDEDIRRRLWSVHIPAATPTANDFNFDDLARKFPLSGGYIRNSALRAAFLAAQERLPLTQDHLLRAIALEYRELGKLSASGRIE